MGAVPWRALGLLTWTVQTPKTVTPMKLKVCGPTRPPKRRQTVWREYLRAMTTRTILLRKYMRILTLRARTYEDGVYTNENIWSPFPIRSMDCTVLSTCARNKRAAPRQFTCVVRPRKRRNIIPPMRTRLSSTLGATVQRSDYNATLLP